MSTESLYAITINGTMLYVKENLSEQECVAIELIAQQFQCPNKNSAACKVICKEFIKAVKTSLNISLVHIPLQYVFRIG